MTTTTPCSATTAEKVFPTFIRYVSANVLGMIGYSCYILADTFFCCPGNRLGCDCCT